MSAIAFYPYKEDPLLRSIRIKTWFIAVTNASGLSKRELEEKFREDDGRKVKRSCIWNKYNRGEVAPRAGYRKDGRPNLLEQVEACYPGTSTWLRSPIWRLSDPAPMEMSEIRTVYLSLPPQIRALYIASEASADDRFWRRNTKAETAFSALSRIKDLSAFTAALAMLRETEIIQSPLAYKTTIGAIVELMKMLENRTTGPLANGGLFNYLLCQYRLSAMNKR